MGRPSLSPQSYNYPGSILLTNTDSNPKSLHCGCFLKGWDLPCPKEQLGDQVYRVQTKYQLLAG